MSPESKNEEKAVKQSLKDVEHAQKEEQRAGKAKLAAAGVSDMDCRWMSLG